MEFLYNLLHHIRAQEFHFSLIRHAETGLKVRRMAICSHNI